MTSKKNISKKKNGEIGCQMDKKIILTVVDVRQAVLLQRFIDEVDPQAFLMVTKSSEVVGKGFMSYI